MTTAWLRHVKSVNNAVEGCMGIPPFILSEQEVAGDYTYSHYDGQYDQSRLDDLLHPLTEDDGV